MIRTEEDIYTEIQNYIKGGKHNRPYTLGTIKKELRTPRIIELIFSRPDVFKLEKEIIYVPLEHRTERLLMKLVLGDPKTLSTVDENGPLPILIKDEEQTLPILIAFELAKRIYERRSALVWGSSGERLYYTRNSKLYRDDITAHCDRLTKLVKSTLNKEISNLSQIELMEIIENYCRLINTPLQETEKYERKYYYVEWNVDKRLWILVSGLPDAGKTTFSKILSGIIRGSLCSDSDILDQMNLSGYPISSLVCATDRIVIFSDIYADTAIDTEEMKNAYVVNVVIEPISIEVMYRHSKDMQRIPFEKYKEDEIDKHNFVRIKNPIIVKNDYNTNRIYQEIDKVIEEIAHRLGLPLQPALAVQETKVR